MLWYKHLGPMQDMVEQKDQAAIFSFKNLEIIWKQRQPTQERISQKWTFSAFENSDPNHLFFW